MGRALVRPAARRDLIRHFAYIGEKSGLTAARRFHVAAHLTFDELGEAPRIGAPRHVAKFPNLRMWRVQEFEKYPIFYKPVKDGVQIERIVHAAQDYTRILATP
jgi:toxin ParE1/3/4